MQSLLNHRSFVPFPLFCPFHFPCLPRLPVWFITLFTICSKNATKHWAGPLINVHNTPPFRTQSLNFYWYLGNKQRSPFTSSTKSQLLQFYLRSPISSLSPSPSLPVYLTRTLCCCFWLSRLGACSHPPVKMYQYLVLGQGHCGHGK